MFNGSDYEGHLSYIGKKMCLSEEVFKNTFVKYIEM